MEGTTRTTWRSELVKYVKRKHNVYNMSTALYMMEPLERTIINCIVLMVLSLVLYSSFVYLPHYTLKLLVFSGILSSPGTVAVVGDGETIQDYNAEL